MGSWQWSRTRSCRTSQSRRSGRQHGDPAQRRAHACPARRPCRESATATAHPAGRSRAAASVLTAASSASGSRTRQRRRRIRIPSRRLQTSAPPCCWCASSRDFDDRGDRQVAQHQQQQHAAQADGADPGGHRPEAGGVIGLGRRQEVVVLRDDQQHEMVAPHAPPWRRVPTRNSTMRAAPHRAEPQHVDRQQAGCRRSARSWRHTGRSSGASSPTRS